MSKEFVDALAAGSNLEAEKAFSISMTTKVGSALETKRKELANTLIKNQRLEADVNETD